MSDTDTMMMVATLDYSDAADWPLDRLAAEIRFRHQEAEDSVKNAMRCALQLGEMLTTVKAKIAHGEFEKWVTDNTPIAVRTARAYMRLSRGFNELPGQDRQRVADLPIREAIKAITTPSALPKRLLSPEWQEPRRERREQLVERIRRSLSYLRASTVRRVEIGLLRSGDIDKARRQLQGLLGVLDELEKEAAAQQEVADGGPP